MGSHPAFRKPNIYSPIDINFENYEVFSFEPFHDIGKHIENVAEFPSHLPA